MKKIDRLMPAEWEPHDATWIAWPHNSDDWPSKFEPIPSVYVEIVRHLSRAGAVEILCHSEEVEAEALLQLRTFGVAERNVRTHLVPTNRSWLRDSAPTAVWCGGRVSWVQWQFSAWAKYDDFELDCQVPQAVARISGLNLCAATHNGTTVVLEGGAIDTDGDGTLLVTEECLLSSVQCRNPELAKHDYEEVFRNYLGIKHTIWLPRGIAGDDTHGHIDDIARFVAPGTVVLAFEDNPQEELNYQSSRDCYSVLCDSRDAQGRNLRIVKLPMPAPVFFEGQRLPASYANFYITNDIVLVPTFHDPHDRAALKTLASLVPTREVVGVDARDLVLGLGTLHCLTQQQPRPPHA
jgi:agmatine deiminase